ncbi:MAG TPA: aldehyde dehydrogenase family protein, partial [Puia sp.]|nr:aldehyde dehydrogenase family protein [Puia sp.]
MHIINPATEELIVDIPEDSIHTVNDKFLMLKKGQPAWAATPVRNRITSIQKFSELLEQHKEELAKTLTAEMGKPLQQSFNELKGAAKRIQYFIDQSEKWLAEEWIVSEGDMREKITYEPLGVIANISAWNYPYLVGVNVVIPALIGGNAVCYKPSEYATLTGLHITRLLYQAGIPENCFQQVVGKGTVGGYLLQLPFDGYFFTGSYKTGKYIA